MRTKDNICKIKRRVEFAPLMEIISDTKALTPSKEITKTVNTTPTITAKSKTVINNLMIRDLFDRISVQSRNMGHHGSGRNTPPATILRKLKAWPIPPKPLKS